VEKNKNVVPIYANIKLVQQEIERIEAIAAKRYVSKREKGITSKTIDKKHSQQEVDSLGVAGEFVVAKYLDLQLNEEELLIGDGGVDLITPRGFTIDVKTCRRSGWDFALSTNTLDSFKSDIGVLVWAGEIYCIAGWTTKLHFAMYCKETDFGYGERLVIRNKDMFDPWMLLKAIKGGRI
jgi:hypothetical protein